ncbi:MAG: AAA domain-containing protein [Saprospiraceae bacterium]|nr:AAA domain-containing protein [Saprospiraceae bacterium]
MQHQTLDQRLIEQLKQKLLNTSRYSIYLDALPQHYLTRLDLAELGKSKVEVPVEFLKGLLTQANIEFRIQLDPNNSVDQSIMERLDTMFIENKDHYSEHGQNTFAFGYPILVRRDYKNPNRIIKAPLFLWSLDIEQSLENRQEWIIRRKDYYAVLTNPVLAAHLLDDAGLNLVPVYDQFLEDDIIDQQELIHVAYLQLRQINPFLSPTVKQEFTKSMQQVMSMSNLENAQDFPLREAMIQWSGVFGLFRTDREAIIRDYEQLLNELDTFEHKIQQLNSDLGKGSSFMKHAFTLVDTDPSQQHFIHLLGKGYHPILQGAPGTGKTRTLTAILANIVSNGGNCLVISDQKNTLETLEQNMTEVGLGELTALIEDEYRDRKQLLESVYKRAANKVPPYRPSAGFIRVMKSCATQIQELQQFHKKLQTPLIGEMKWADLVCAYLNTKDDQLERILSNQMAKLRFKYTNEECTEICSILAEGYPLYKQLGTLKHPLNVLNEHFFKEANIYQVSNQLKESLKNVVYVVDSAQRDLLTYLFDYEKQLENHYTEVFHQKATYTDDVINIIEEAFKISKFYFNKKGGLGRSVLGMFGSKYKELRERKKLLYDTYRNLVRYHGKYQYFKHEFIGAKLEEEEVELILDNLKSYKGRLSEWYAEIEDRIRLEKNSLSLGNLHPHANFEKQTRELVRNLDLLAINLKNANMFKAGFQYSSSNVRKRLTDLEELRANLSKIEETMPDFEAYHSLKFFWAHLSPLQRDVFRAMTETKVVDWQYGFRLWYYGAMLKQQVDQHLPQEANYRTVLKHLSMERAQLKTMLHKHTVAYWRSKQSDITKHFQKQHAPNTVQQLYHWRGNSTQNVSLPKVVQYEPEVFTSFFPIVLTTPSLCSAILPLEPSLFDVVIFDNANQLRLEDTYAAMLRGKYKIIAGDQQQSPPSDQFSSAQPANTDSDKDFIWLDDEFMLGHDDNQLYHSMGGSIYRTSLLEYAQGRLHHKEDWLKVHYRAAHPSLVDFSNAAFYGNRLNPMPAKSPYQAIHFIQVNGVYIKEQNRAEAQQIIAHLKGLEGMKEVPKIGIAACTLAQRNYIWKLFREELIKERDSKGILHQLYHAGLLIKTLENIQNDELDVLLFSVTFGEDSKQKFVEDYGILQKQSGHLLLNGLIMRVKRAVHVFTSIPERYYERYLGNIPQKGNVSKGVFYAYLAYTKAVATGDQATRKGILELLSRHCTQHVDNHQIIAHKEGVFRELVLEFLQKHFKTDQLIKDYEHAGFQLPIAIKNANEELSVVLFFDLYNDHPLEEAYAWDVFEEHHLNELGLVCIRVWSYNWWMDRDKAEKDLLNQIKNGLLTNA